MVRKQKKELAENFKAESHKILAFIKTKVGSVEDSEDLLQDIYLTAVSNLNIFDSIDNLTGWIYIAARNKIIDLYRRYKPKTVSIDVANENGLEFSEILTDELRDTPEEDRKWIYELIIDCVDNLPEKQKYVFIQQTINGKTFKQIAEETDDSQNTLIARKRYAVITLRKQLKQIKQFMDEGQV